MKLIRTIIRGLLSLLTISMLIYLNVKTRDNIQLIGQFKYETLDTIKTDSLDMRYKFDLLDNETTKFSGQILEDTSHVNEGIRYLMGVLGIFIISELGFHLNGKGKRAD